MLEYNTAATSWGSAEAEVYADYMWVASYIGNNKVAYGDWTNASTPQREAAIRQATRDIDGLTYTGDKLYIYQRLQFPRARDFNPYGLPYTLSYSMYPDAWYEELDLKLACAEQSLSVLRTGGVNEHLERRMQGISSVSESVARISESYSYSGITLRICPEAYDVLKKYLGMPKLVRR